MMNLYIIVIAYGVLYYAYTNTQHSCKVVKTVDNVDLDRFIEHTWYSQYQQEVKYQTRDSFYCVSATYNLELDRKVPLFSGKVISVYNYANYEKVNGVPMNTRNGTVLCAKQPIAYDNSKLVVSPCNLPSFFGGPYWIIGLQENYEWAVISGGQPKNQYSDGCTTNVNTTNNSGLWIFSRYPIMPKDHLNDANKLLKSKGYTLSQLLPVEQDGCLYKDAFIK